LFKQRQAWRTQLQTADDPATVLLLACLLLFQGVHRHAMLNVPGRLVPAVLTHLRTGGLLPAPTLAALTELQTAVIDARRGHALTDAAAGAAAHVDAVRQLALGTGAPGPTDSAAPE
jgi:hypothetical protein